MDFMPNVWIKNGDFSLREVVSVPDAAEFLEAWPHDKRNPFFYLAENAMQAAINGSIPVEEARDAFETFCTEAGILADEPPKG
ncbi:DUF982 domain-containing protein [Aminobacter sp. P9b]|uniref:DUF982 domain-containing protein n=1 Tax=Aminobacter sp. P9b TaxID=3133697 RepID=UPI003244C0FD